jgi:hypothetical protein
MFRPGQIALVLAMAAIPSFAAAQEATPSGQDGFGAPAVPSIGVGTEAAAAAACDNSAFGAGFGGGDVKRYKLFVLYALTCYNTVSCAAVSPGSWTLNSQQKCEKANCGKVSYGTLTGLSLGGGACPGHKYTFAAMCYTWNEHIDWKVTDQIAASWAANAPNCSLSYQFPLTVPIVYPSSETTEAEGWDANANGKWQQTLHAASDPNFDWSLNSVKEKDPGPDNPANDTCWCKGSAQPAFYKITGGQWPAGGFGPDEKGVWGYDHVGMGYNRYRYYRLKQRAPCGTHFPQQMQFQATNVTGSKGPWENYASVNTLGGSFTYQDITSLRAGQSQTEVYESGPTKSRLQCSQIKWPAPPPALGASIVVNDPRPVAAAIEEIEKLSGTPITYEDPPFLNKYYMMPMVQGADDDPSLLVPRGGSLLVKLPADASAAQAVAAVQNMVENYNASQDAATFSVSQDGLTHVVPRQTVDLSGQRALVTPGLDAKITLAAQPRSAMELLGEICRAVSVVSGQPVEMGVVPTNALQRQIEIGADNQPARKVLEKLIVASGMPLSWSLLYDPGLKTYYLNIPIIERPSDQP